MWIGVHNNLRRLLLLSCGTMVGAVVILGARMTLSYEAAEGTPAEPPTRWPSASSIHRDDKRFSLVLLAHPDCPCTRASLSELERIMTNVQDAVAAVVVFTKPGASAADAENTFSWRRAAAIPGVAVRFDDDARETALFGGRVSGQTLLYDPEGRLTFTGGITGTRGHEGENPGSNAVIEQVRREHQELLHAPVFGCSLQDPTQQELNVNSWWRKR